MKEAIGDMKPYILENYEILLRDRKLCLDDEKKNENTMSLRKLEEMALSLYGFSFIDNELKQLKEKYGF